MANLKEIRNRISSVSSTMQITGAMKMVSAAKLKKAQDIITQMRPYAEKLTELLQNLSGAINEDAEGSFTRKKATLDKVLLVTITSNRGLCGGFNSSIVKKTIQLIKTSYENAAVEVLTIGKKGNDVLSKSQTIAANHSDLFDNLTFKNVSAVAQEIMDYFMEEKYDRVVLIYNQFKNVATQIPVEESFLPIETKEEKTTSSAVDYIFEPSKEEIVKELIPKSLKTQLYKAICDSFASEHGARMTAMHKATDNANELRNDLKLTYNKARQAAITGEILEIVGGAEALNN